MQTWLLTLADAFAQGLGWATGAVIALWVLVTLGWWPL